MTEIALEDKKKRHQFKIIRKELITPDTLRVFFELPTPNHRLGVKSGQHVFLIANIDNEEIYRKYTPLNLEEHTGSFEMIIKVRLGSKKFFSKLSFNY
jgi:NAD(P)H-flavin reductase